MRLLIALAAAADDDDDDDDDDDNGSNDRPLSGSRSSSAGYRILSQPSLRSTVFALDSRPFVARFAL